MTYNSKKSSKNQQASSTFCKPKKLAVVQAVEKLIASDIAKSFYFSFSEDEVYISRNGFLEATQPEYIPELQSSIGYSKGEKSRFYSLLKQTFGPTRCVNSLWELTPESSCFFQNGIILAIDDRDKSGIRKPIIYNSANYQGKPFASCIKANINLGVLERGYNYDMPYLKENAPNFWYYLQTSFSLEESRRRILLMLGQVLTPFANCNIPNIWNLIGEPGSGKGVIVEFLQNVFDPDAVAVLNGVPTKNDRWALSPVATARKAPTLLISPDTQIVDVANPLPFKLIAGGNGLMVEAKGRDVKRTSKNLTWILCSNSQLRFRAEVEQIAEKIGEIPFQTTTNFRHSSANLTNLSQLLTNEADAILSFAWGFFARNIIEKTCFDFSFHQKSLDNDLENNALLRFLVKHCKKSDSNYLTTNDVAELFRNTLEGGYAEWFEGGNKDSLSKHFIQTWDRWRKQENIKSKIVRIAGKPQRANPIEYSEENLEPDMQDIVQPLFQPKTIDEISF